MNYNRWSAFIQFVFKSVQRRGAITNDLEHLCEPISVLILINGFFSMKNFLALSLYV